MRRGRREDKILNLTLYAIGALKTGPEKELIRRYETRLKSLAPANGFSAPILKEAVVKKALEGDALKAAEAGELMKDYPENGRLILLDEGGENLDSLRFADRLARFRDEGVKECRFIIGGAAGLCPDLKKRADVTLAFGKMTWAHMLARAMLYEQIYRAVTILSGSPYHKA